MTDNDIRTFFADTNNISQTNTKISGTIGQIGAIGPSAKGKRWSKEEDARLLDQVSREIPTSDIADQHNRTQGGITSRLREIACRMSSENVSLEEIKRLTTLSECQITDAIAKKACSTRKRKEVQSTALSKQRSVPSTGSAGSAGTAGPAGPVGPVATKDVLSVEQQCALQQFEDGDNLFITGEGGTGKTRLIQHLVKATKNTGKKIQVTALTGCASLLLECGARTIHSWSGIKLGNGDPEDIASNILYNYMATKAWRTTDILVVDEVSMMSKRIFDMLNYVGMRVRGSTRPFGGIQVVFVGDFFQLPPVAGRDMMDGDDQFCFESDDWKTVFPMDNHIVLQTMFRQEDALFRSILGNVRKGVVRDQDTEVLEKHVGREVDVEACCGITPTKLLPTRSKVDTINRDMFAKLKGELHPFPFIEKKNCMKYIGGGAETDIPLAILSKCRRNMTPQKAGFEVDRLVNNSPCVKDLQLKVGANVMCTVNLDLENGICNGSIGTVIAFRAVGAAASAALKQGSAAAGSAAAGSAANICGGVSSSTVDVLAPVVLFTNGRRVTMPMKFWQSEDYPTVAVGQYPLCLAWAMTIHKIQGATLSMAEIDIGSGIFECGQTYVALSRVKNLVGLYLSSFDSSKIKTNRKVKQFYDSIPLVEYEVEDEEEEEEEEDEEERNVEVKVEEIKVEVKGEKVEVSTTNRLDQFQYYEYYETV